MAIMDARVAAAVSGHAEFQRLSAKYPVVRLVEWMKNTGREEPAVSIGHLINRTKKEPSLFIHGIVMREMTRLEALEVKAVSTRTIYSPSIDGKEYVFERNAGKRAQYEFLRSVGREVMDAEISYLALAFAYLSVAKEYRLEFPAYRDICQTIKAGRKSGAFPEYHQPLEIADFKTAINLLRLGGDACKGEAYASMHALSFIMNEKPQIPAILDLI